MEKLKPEPKLTHMPEQIKQKIIDRTPDVKTKKALGMVSKEFLDHFYESPTKYHHANFAFHAEKVTVTMSMRGGKRRMEFLAHQGGVLIKNLESNWEKTLPETDYRKAAVQYLLKHLGRSKTKLQMLEFEERMDDYEVIARDRKVIFDEMERILRSLDHKLHVELFECFVHASDSQIMQILPYLKAGTLRNLDFRTFDTETPPMSLTLISETPQWKGADSLVLYDSKCEVPVENLSHFVLLELDVRKLSVPVKTLVQACLESPTVEELTLECEENLDKTDLAEYLAQFEDFDEWEGDDDPYALYFLLPGWPMKTAKVRCLAKHLCFSRFEL